MSDKDEILFLKPVFKQMIWGGERLKTNYGYEIPGDKTGECWAVSAHSSGDCIVDGGKYDKVALSILWKEHKELFGNVQGEVFPLLIKIIDAKEDLSIQVHPDDEYAKIHENGALGKTECWYILDCDKDASIVIGHNAKDKAELKQMIEEKRWNELICTRPIKKGDFFQIEPGTVHAIKGGTLILETQQNSDITYRLYDYDRLQNGQPRQLHIEKSIDVINCPQGETTIEPNIEKYQGGTVTTLVECKYYKVFKIEVTDSITMSQEEPFTIFSVIEGTGSINDRTIKAGEHFILPNGFKTYKISGMITLISSCVVR